MGERLESRLKESIQFLEIDIHSNDISSVQTYRGMLGEQKVVGKVYTNEKVIEAIDKTNFGEKILQYRGSVNFNDKKIQIFESYSFNLKEYMEKNAKSQLQLEGYEKAVLKEGLLDQKFEPKKAFRDTFGDVFEGLSELRANGLDHGKLSMENVVIVRIGYGTRMIAKLTGMVKENKECDLKAIQSLVRNILTGAGTGTGTKGRMCTEGFEFLKSMVPKHSWDEGGIEYTRLNFVKNRFFRDPKGLYNHPLFWSEKTCASFYIALGNLIVAAGQASDSLVGGNRSAFEDSLNERDDDVQNWRAEVKPGLMSKPYKYKDTVSSLIVFIRDTGVHYFQKEKVQGALNNSYPEGFVNYFKDFKRWLLMYAYKNLLTHFTVLKNVADGDYMRKYLRGHHEEAD